MTAATNLFTLHLQGSPRIRHLSLGRATVNVRHGALACFRKNRTVARAGSSPARVAGGGSAPSAGGKGAGSKEPGAGATRHALPRRGLRSRRRRTRTRQYASPPHRADSSPPWPFSIAASVGAIKLYRARGEPPGHPPEEDGPPSCACFFAPCRPSASPR